MQVGDAISVMSETVCNYDEHMKPVYGMIKGTICYIHPKNRYFTVEFPSGLRESFICRT